MHARWPRTCAGASGAPSSGMAPSLLPPAARRTWRPLSLLPPTAHGVSGGPTGGTCVGARCMWLPPLLPPAARTWWSQIRQRQHVGELDPAVARAGRPLSAAAGRAWSRIRQRGARGGLSRRWRCPGEPIQLRRARGPPTRWGDVKQAGSTVGSETG